MMSYTIARGLKPGEEFDVPGLCEFTCELGLDAIDWVSTYGYDPAEIRAIADDHGLRCACHTFFCDLNFPTPGQRAPGREAFKAGIEACCVLGADKVMLPVPGKEEVGREQGFRNVMEGLREVIGFADNDGVTVTVEHFPSAYSPFVVSADVNRAIKQIPQLRVTFDNGNVVTGGESPRDAVLNSAGYIVHAHLKDFAACEDSHPAGRRCLDGKFRRPVLVGDGEVDQIGGLAALKEIGYGGYINFEYEGSEWTPRDATVEGVRRMREMLDSLG